MLKFNNKNKNNNNTDQKNKLRNLNLKEHRKQTNINVEIIKEEEDLIRCLLFDLSTTTTTTKSINFCSLFFRCFFSLYVCALFSTTNSPLYPTRITNVIFSFLSFSLFRLIIN